MTVEMVATRPIEGQKPGTSGLRRKTREFMEPGYLENYIQSVFDAIGGVGAKTLVVGGDGRFHNDAAIGTILGMAAANGAARCIVGQGGLLSTPAASHLIRHRKADGGLILSASHNPGGPDGDFGVKYNTANGGPASGEVMERIHARTREIDSYRILEAGPAGLGATGKAALGGMEVEIVDPVADYARLMEGLFDFDSIAAMFKGGFRMRFDAMHAVTGPYAREIFENRLGAPAGTVAGGTPKPDFGGGHPDPNPVRAKSLMDEMHGDGAPDFGAASDGDGDRNMILGRGCYVGASDSLAVLADLAHHAPGYAGGIAGIARSMPTSSAADRVAAAKGVEIHETPTGWRYFGSLLDAGRVTICGEESAGTGSGHIREKDGIWAVLLWLNILAATGKSVAGTMADHWRAYGRHYYTRHDYEGVDEDAAHGLVGALGDRLAGLAGTGAAGLTVESADEFAYEDPVDGAKAAGQGVRIFFEGGGRAVLRLSGTGTEGATIRVYLERYESESGELGLDPQKALSGIIRAVDGIAELQARTGRSGPDVIT